MKNDKKYKAFDWIPYLFGNEEPDQEDEDKDKTEEKADEPKKNKKKRKGIDDENPVSFRTTTGRLSIQQIIYFIFRDLIYASGPMFAYIGITLLCIILGYPLSGQTRHGFQAYLSERSNFMIALGVVITLRYLYKKSRKRGSTFFEDASLFRTNVDKKKIVLCFLFGAGVALFISSLLTLIPKVWIFASYDQSVSRIYQRYDIFLTIIESAVLTPLVEEIIFRGYMLNRLLKRWDDIPALIVTTFIFSFMHGSSIWVIYAFIMGYILGRLSMIEGNIIYGIFLHAGFNLPSVVQWFIYFIWPDLQSDSYITNIFETILIGTTGLIVSVIIYMLYKNRLETAG
ncbi:MAG: CPBP family intramembrane metalloprotease [Butyrivibrio sp.]|nr:CPBP family intramembrane metalloprotease [Butyrivibrio sp.]